jgi:hypothetical protein
VELIESIEFSHEPAHLNITTLGSDRPRKAAAHYGRMRLAMERGLLLFQQATRDLGPSVGNKYRCKNRQAMHPIDELVSNAFCNKINTNKINSKASSRRHQIT